MTIFATFSCGQFENNDIYKTKGEEYASKKGNFVADFPIEPNHTAIDNQIGLDKFEIHLYRSAFAGRKIFNVEYNDYPTHMLKSLTTEELYNQAVNNFAYKVADNFDLIYQKSIEQNGLQGQAFQLELNDNAKKKGHDGFIMGRIFKDENRVYTVTYMGIDDNRVGSFLESFRLLR